MVDVRSAVVVASEYFSSLQDMIGNQIEDLRLEEAELSEDKEHWFITLGFIRPVDKTSDSVHDWMENRIYEREYKVFKIDATTGEVQSMKIREV